MSSINSLQLRADVPATNPFVREVHALTTLVSAASLKPARLLHLLEQRIDALVNLCELSLAEVDAYEMLALAQRGGNLADLAKGHCALAQVRTRKERYAQAMQSASDAEVAAQRCRRAAVREPLLALALLRKASAAVRLELPQAANDAERAAERFAALGDMARQGQALRVQAAASLAQADTVAHRALAEQAVALARQAGTAGDLCFALMTAYGNHPDLAQSARWLQEAHRVARDAGELLPQAAAEHGLCLLYFRLGLYHRALRLMQHSIVLREPGLTDAGRVNVFGFVAMLSAICGDTVSARDAMAIMLAAHEREPNARNLTLAPWFESAYLFWMDSDPHRALQLIRRAAARERGWSKSMMLRLLAKQE
ncbi:MAG: hypothetical protein ACKOD9_21910, partial [Rubrivivax sp.]